MKNYYYLIFLGLFFCKSLAQDTLVVNPPVSLDSYYKKLILPSAMVAGGIVLKYSFFQDNAKEQVQKSFGKDYQLHIDDYLQFVPMAQLFSGKLLGYKSTNDYNRKIANTIVANALVFGSVQLCKKSLNDKRPNGSGNNSFPSGHTTFAFANATLLYLEYKDANFWYASSGYVFATATGVLRMANNRHWLGDVVAGAGWGIGIATLVYYWNPNLISIKKKKETSFVGFPVIQDNTYGVGMVYRMR